MKIKSLTALTVVAALAAPMSLFAETRRAGRTEMEQLAAELSRVLGSGRVEVRSGGPRAAGRRAEARRSTEDDVIAAMNRERAAHGLGPLRVNERLALAAQDRVTDLFKKRYFDHVSPDGVQPFVWAQRRGYDYAIIGENLAAGYRSAGAVVDGWMRSPGHRANILGRDFDEVGVAVAPGSPVGNYGGPTYVALYASR
jgi:uncharacterized protein YkwD